MKELFRGLENNKGKLLALENVVGVGIGYKKVGLTRTDQPAIIVFVQKKLPPGQVKRGHLVPKKVGLWVTDVVEIGDVRFLSRTGRLRPVQPGTSIGHYRITAGTLGAVVKDKETGAPLLLSNNHVLANITTGRDGRANIGDPILQPGGCVTILIK